MAVEPRLFVDTWGWLALANDGDAAFDGVSRIRATAAGRLGAWVTTDYVLDETMDRLFAALALRFESLFLALGSFRRALHQLAADQLDHGLLGAVALAEPQPHDARVATLALAEPRAQRVEQLLDRFRGLEERSGLPPRV